MHYLALSVENIVTVLLIAGVGLAIWTVVGQGVLHARGAQ